MRRALEYARGFDVTLAQHCEDDALAARRAHARRGVVEPPRCPGDPGRGRGADGGPRHRPGAAHRRPRALPAPLDGGVGRAGGRGQGRGPGRDGRGHPAPPVAHRRRARRLRPGVQGEPAAARPRPTSPPCAPRARRGRSTPSPPTTPPIRPSARTPPSTRPRRGCSASRRRSRWPRRLGAHGNGRATGADDGMAASRRCGEHVARTSCPLSWHPARIAGLARRPGRRPGRAASSPARPPTSASSTPPPRGRSTPPDWPAGAATRRGRGASHRPGPPHRASGASPSWSTPRRSDERRSAGSVGPRRDGDGGLVGGRAPALLVLADGEVFEGEAVGAVPPGGVATGELVFNTVLSGYQEVVTDPSYAGQVVAFTYPHIGNYGVTADDDEAARPWCRGVVVRDLPARPVVVARHGLARGLPRSRRGLPGITGRRHPPAHPPPARRRRHGLRLRHRARVGAAPPRRRPSRAPPGATS